MNKIGEVFRGLFSLLSVLVLIAIVLKVFFVDVVVVPHNGMAPTLVYGDHVLVWRNASVDMANIVICEHPGKPEARVLGRAVAFAGHTVSTDRTGDLLVDDDRASPQWEGPLRFYDAPRDRLSSMRLGSIDYRRQHRHQFMIETEASFDLTSYHVDRGVYLLGDNRSDPADDSREFGEVDPAHCRGQVFMRLSPAPPQNDDIRHGYLDWIQ
jgi:signal peptidase I